MRNLKPSRPLPAAAVLAVLLAQGCQSVQRSPHEETLVLPEFETTRIVDVALLKPQIAGPGSNVLGRHIREEARRLLIDRKLYSVPADAYVDRTMIAAGGPAPSEALEPLGSDAVLTVEILQWDIGSLTPRGYVWASGIFTLWGSSGPLWRYEFADKKVLAPFPVTATNRDEASAACARALVREALTPLPAKRPTR